MAGTGWRLQAGIAGLLSRASPGTLATPRTFVSSRTRFWSLRAKASCVSRFFLSSSSWLLTWRTSSWSCCRAFSSPRALHEKGERAER